jgi:hypothetical protein
MLPLVTSHKLFSFVKQGLKRTRLSAVGTSVLGGLIFRQLRSVNEFEAYQRRGTYTVSEILSLGDIGTWFDDAIHGCISIGRDELPLRPLLY